MGKNVPAVHTRATTAPCVGAENGLPRLVASGLVRMDAGICRVRGISLTVGAGEVVGLVGRRGAGKSSCLSLLAGAGEPTFGVLRICGTIARDGATARAFVGTNLLTDRADTHVSERLSRPAGGAGEQRVRSILAAAAGCPPVVILDEPTSGLSAEQAGRVTRFIHGLRTAGKAVLISLDNADLGTVGCDRLYLIEDGTIVARGTLAELRATCSI